MCHIIPNVLNSPPCRIFTGLSSAAPRPSKPPTPKPSCPKGLSVTWARSSPSSIPVAPWLCCKNSDKKGDCKVGQAAFPYGPRQKLVCCQCPSGQVLNKDKNCCIPTVSPMPSSPPSEALTPSPTAKPTTTPTYQPTPSPTLEPSSPPTSQPTPSPIVKPLSLPTYQPTPSPTLLPTDTPTESGTTIPPPPDCKNGYMTTRSLSLQEVILGKNEFLRPGFEMCCRKRPPNKSCVISDQNLLRIAPTPDEECCYCKDPKKEWNPAVVVIPVAGYCITVL